MRPGEPIPPGMEDIVETKCQIQDTLDNYNSGPLIGIEYIVELVCIVRVYQIILINSSVSYNIVKY